MVLFCLGGILFGKSSPMFSHFSPLGLGTISGYDVELCGLYSMFRSS